ncbi:hypothetical protein PMAYCL1PPCAC_10183, partial [Pristionchus mayeri]
GGAIIFEIPNFSSLKAKRDGGDARYSPKVDVKGVLWKVSVSRAPDGLQVILHCLANQLTNFRISANADVIIICHRDYSENHVYEDIPCLFSEQHSCNRVYSSRWEDFISNGWGFIRDDQVTFEIRFRITDMKGIKYYNRIDFHLEDPRSDVKLLIKGVRISAKIHASKQILAVHSSVFQAMFFGGFDEQNKDEVELKNIDPNEFVDVLNVLYPPYEKITCKTMLIGYDYDS